MLRINIVAKLQAPSDQLWVCLSNKNLLLWNELLYFIGDHLGLFF